MQDTPVVKEAAQEFKESLIFEKTPTVSEMRLSFGLPEHFDMEGQAREMDVKRKEAVEKYKKQYPIEEAKMSPTALFEKMHKALVLSGRYYSKDITYFEKRINDAISDLNSQGISSSEQIINFLELKRLSEFTQYYDIDLDKFRRLNYDMANDKVFEFLSYDLSKLAKKESIKLFNLDLSNNQEIMHLSEILNTNPKSINTLIDLMGSSVFELDAKGLEDRLKNINKIPDIKLSKSLEVLRKYSFLFPGKYGNSSLEKSDLLLKLLNQESISDEQVDILNTAEQIYAILGERISQLYLFDGKKNILDMHQELTGVLVMLEAVTYEYIKETNNPKTEYYDFYLIKQKYPESPYYILFYSEIAILRLLNNPEFDSHTTAKVLQKGFSLGPWAALNMLAKGIDFNNTSKGIEEILNNSLDKDLINLMGNFRNDFGIPLKEMPSAKRFIKSQEFNAIINLINHVGDTPKNKLHLLKNLIKFKASNNSRSSANVDYEIDYDLLRTQAEKFLTSNSVSSRQKIFWNVWLNQHGSREFLKYKSFADIYKNFDNLRFNEENQTEIKQEIYSCLSPTEQKFFDMLEQLPNSLREQLEQNGYLDNLEINEATISNLGNISSVISRLSKSSSKEIRKLKDLILPIVIQSADPESSIEQIISVFEKNNLPEIAKIYRVFEISYSKESIDKVLRNKSLSPVLTDAGEKRRYDIFYRDLLKVHIDSGNSSLYKYLLALKDGQTLIDKVGSGGLASLSRDTEMPQLIRFLDRMDTLLENSLYGRRSGYKSTKNTDILERIENLRKNYGLKNGENFTERVANMFVKPVGYKSIDEVLAKMDSAKKIAHDRNIEFVRNLGTNNIFSQGSLLKGVNSNFMELQFQNGIVAKEFLGADADSDYTPFDTDFDRIDENFYLGDSYANKYGDIAILIKDRGQFQRTRHERGERAEYELGKYELFYSGVVGDRHFGVRTGIASTEIDAIINLGIDSENSERIYFSIAQNGFYIPVFDKDEKLLFTPEMFEQYRIAAQDLQDYFKNNTRSSEELIGVLKKSPYIKSLFESGVGVWEGYTLEQHTEMVLDQYEKYFAGRWKSPLISEDSFRVLLALHDLGKPLAVKMTGSAHDQHEYTMRFLPRILERLGMNSAQAELVTALVSGDYIGQYIQGNIGLEETGRMINMKAREIGVPVDQFFELLKMYYACDAGAYTTDAGGKASLDSLFIFDSERASIQLSSEVQKKLYELSPYLYLE